MIHYLISIKSNVNNFHEPDAKFPNLIFYDTNRTKNNIEFNVRCLLSRFCELKTQNNHKFA